MPIYLPCFPLNPVLSIVQVTTKVHYLAHTVCCASVLRHIYVYPSVFKKRCLYVTSINLSFCIKVCTIMTSLSVTGW